MKPKKKDIVDRNVYRSVKCTLKTVLKRHNDIQPVIDRTVKNINNFAIIGYSCLPSHQSANYVSAS